MQEFYLYLCANTKSAVSSLSVYQRGCSRPATLYFMPLLLPSSDAQNARRMSESRAHLPNNKNIKYGKGASSHQFISFSLDYAELKYIWNVYICSIQYVRKWRVGSELIAITIKWRTYLFQRRCLCVANAKSRISRKRGKKSISISTRWAWLLIIIGIRKFIIADIKYADTINPMAGICSLVFCYICSLASGWNFMVIFVHELCISRLVVMFVFMPANMLLTRGVWNDSSPILLSVTIQTLWWWRMIGSQDYDCNAILYERQCQRRHEKQTRKKRGKKIRRAKK